MNYDICLIVVVAMADRKKCGEIYGEKKSVVVSSSLIKFDPSTYVYNSRFDLGIGEEGLPKYPAMATE